MNEDKFNHLYKKKTLQQVVKKLHSLPSAVEKISYWYENGLRWLELKESSRIGELDLEPFKFEIAPDEYGEVNQWIIDNFLSLGWGTDEEKKSRFLDLGELRENFEKAYKQHPDKKLIQNELKRINKSFVPVTGGIFQHKQTGEKRYQNELFYADYAAFEDSKEYDSQPEYNTLYPETWTVLKARNGYVLGQYFNYLKSRMNQPAETELQEGDMPQKILLLHSLGMLKALQEKLPSQNKQAIILKAIVGANTDNIEDKLTALKPMDGRIKKRKNLEFVANALDKVGLTKEAEEARTLLREVYKAEIK